MKHIVLITLKRLLVDVATNWPEFGVNANFARLLSRLAQYLDDLIIHGQSVVKTHEIEINHTDFQCYDLKGLALATAMSNQKIRIIKIMRDRIKINGEGLGLAETKYMVDAIIETLRTAPPIPIEPEYRLLEPDEQGIKFSYAPNLKEIEIEESENNWSAGNIGSDPAPTKYRTKLTRYELAMKRAAGASAADSFVE